MDRVIVGATDVTALNDLSTKTFSVDNTAVYIGKEYPFNSAFFQLRNIPEMPTEKAFTISFWDGMEWVDIDDIIDETQGFTQSGEIRLIYDDEQFERMNRDDSEEIGLSLGKRVNEKYWLRITFAEVPNVDIEHTGVALTDEATMLSIFASLNTYKENLGLSDWSSQIMTASRIAIQTLRAKKVIRSKEQLLDTRQWAIATAYKALAMVYDLIGDRDRSVDANHEYSRLMTEQGKTVDVDLDGKISYEERNRTRTYRLER